VNVILEDELPILYMEEYWNVEDMLIIIIISLSWLELVSSINSILSGIRYLSQGIG